VYSENVGGGKQAAHHLVDRGGTRFVVLGGPSQLATPGERVAGFLEGLAERGIDPSRVHRFDAPYSFDGGREGARRAVAAIPDVDAVFACNDNQAMGVMFELEDLGRRVPDDVIVCGFDGISWSMRVRPSLTTLQQDSTAMAEQAFEMLTAMIVEGVPPRTVVLPVELVERESTNRPAGASSLLGV
jgi:LacI family transcriptional regulator